MATLTIRNLDDGAYDRLKLSARANHRSIEAEARLRLSQIVMTNAAFADALGEAAVPATPDYAGSVDIIRAIRDEE